MSSQNGVNHNPGPAHKDLADPQLCPRCRGAGFVIRDVPMDHPDFGKAIACSCRQQERRERRLATMQRLGSLDALTALTFERFDDAPTFLAADRRYNVRRAYETALAFAEDPEGWLVLTGVYGCGKTHLAAAIANKRLQDGEAALFLVVPDLLDHLRATFSPTSEVRYDELFEQVRNTPLLILDDLGTQASSEWAQEKLFQILNHRYNLRLPTVITTNQRLEDIDPRLRSRFLDVHLVTHFQILAPDFRAGANPEHDDLSSLSLHQTRRFDNFHLRRNELKGDEFANLSEVIEACRRFAENPQGWLVLAGTYGSGKTHLAAAIANYRVEEALSEVMFVVTPDLLDYLRATFDPKSNARLDRRLDSVRRTPVLVLDDLGTESATPWAKEKLFQLLNHRYNAMLPTVITTSATPDEIEPWLRTRMLDVDRCVFCGLIVPGYRGSRTQREKNARRRR